MRITPILLPILAVGMLFMAADMAAVSQTKPNTSTKAPPAPPPAAQVPLKGATPEAAPAAETQPPPANWASRCAAEGRQSAPDCSVEQSIIETKSRQLLMQIVVRVPPDTRKPVLTIQLPLGLFLPAGVTIRFDEGKPERFDVQTCDQKGCYLQMPVSNEMMAEMAKGKQMSVTFQNLGKQDIGVPVSLAGFTVAYDKIK
jgi:invasion protein IalB